MTKKLLQSGFILSALSLFLLPTITYAQVLPCGSIISPGAVSDLNLGIENDFIEDCNDPFGVTIDPPNPYTVQINGVDITPGASVALPGGRTNNVSFEGTPGLTSVDTGIFKHVGNNYEYVSRKRREPTEADYRAFADTYFTTQAERDLYIEITLYNFENTNLDQYFLDSMTGEDIIDEITGETVQTRYYNFIDAMYENFDDSVPYLEAGTYTMLFYEYHLEVSHRTIWDSVRDFLIPTAYAQCQLCIPDRSYTITFTITAQELGASSILFLPGIMGSRLYETGDFCGENKEHELWFSRDDCEQLRMMTNFRGTSVNNVYTKPGEEIIIDSVAGISPLYADWLETLNEWKESDLIHDYRAVPYDWRLSLGDVLKTKESNGRVVYDSTITYRDSYIYKSLEHLVTTSNSGKVSIITHSNGGLVAKTLLNEMKVNNDPLLDNIDTFMLIAVPQTGTPDAITSILHGSELGFGLISDKKTSRALTNTAPFAHHLLPSEQYSENVSSPMIEFLPGSATDFWRSQYGSEINSTEKLHAFLNKNNGRTKPAFEDVLTPEVVDPFLLNYANTIHQGLTQFTPPPSMEVLQLGGVGVDTIESITYFTDRECVNRSIFSFFQCTEYRDKLGYRINKVPQGDGTVILPSALSMPETNNTERVWVNLDQYNKRNIFNRVHRNILEIPELQDFIRGTLSREPFSGNEYVTTEQVTTIAQDRIVYQLHSPLDMVLTSDDGEVSSSTNTLRGAVYERVGELQYISIPSETQNPQLKLFGYKTGSFTLDVEERKDDSLSKRVTFSAIPTSTSTIVSLLLNDVFASSTLLLDEEGDGELDATATTEAVFQYEEIMTTEEVKRNGGTRTHKKPKGEVAGISYSEEYVNQIRTILILLDKVLLLLKIKYV